MEQETSKRLKELDETAETVTKSLDTLKDFIEKTKVTGQLMFAKLKREKLRSLAAIAHYQAAMVEMEMVIMQNELKLKLIQGKAAQSGRDLGLSRTAHIEWSAPAFAASMAKNNDWLTSKLRAVKMDEERFQRMLDDGNAASAPPDSCRVIREQWDVINDLYKELMSTKDMKTKPDADGEEDAHSNASAETLILT